MADTPSTSPAEAPEIKSIKELQDKKADTLKYLQDIPGLTPEEKTGFTAEYEAALKALEAKTDAEKQKDIGNIKAELVKLRESLTNEKQDENQEVDEKEDDEATPESGKQKLSVEKEIRGRLDEFKKNIESKLNTPTTPEAPAEPLPPATQSAIQNAQKFFENKGVKIDTAPVQGNFVSNFFKKIALWFYSILEGVGIDVRGAKAKLEGYTDYVSKQKVDETFKVLAGYMGESVKGITDIKDKEALVSKMEGLGLPIMSGDNLLSGPIMQIIFTGEESAWNNLPDDFDKDILRAIRGKYLTLQDNPKSTGGMNSLQKLNEIFTIEEERKEEYLERYALDEEERSFTAPRKNPDAIPPVPPLPTEPKTPEEEQNAEKERKLSEIEKANTLDKNLKAAKETQPQDQQKIEAAKNELEKLKSEIATKIQDTYKQAVSDLENVENKLKISGITDTEKTKLGEQKKQIETAIAQIKIEAVKLIKDIEKNPAEIHDIDAVKAVQIQHVVEDAYKNIDKFIDGQQKTEAEKLTEEEKKEIEKKETVKKITDLGEKTSKLGGLDNNQVDPEELLNNAEESLKNLESDPNYEKIKDSIKNIVAIIERARNKFDLIKIIKNKIKDRINDIDWDDGDGAWVEHDWNGADYGSIDFDIASGFWTLGFLHNDLRVLNGDIPEDRKIMEKFKNVHEDLLNVIRENKDYIRGTQKEPLAAKVGKVDTKPIVEILNK